MKGKKINIYLVSVILFMFVLPVISIGLEAAATQASISIFLAGKWLVFWAIGVRLFIAGIRQATKPSFTAQQIFRINGTDSFPVIRELGFANICMSIIAMLSIFCPDWRMPAAIMGGLYFGLAGFLHLIKKTESGNETIALVSDLYLFVMMLIYVLIRFYK